MRASYRRYPSSARPSFFPTCRRCLELDEGTREPVRRSAKKWHKQRGRGRGTQEWLSTKFGDTIRNSLAKKPFKREVSPGRVNSRERLELPRRGVLSAPIFSSDVEKKCSKRRFARPSRGSPKTRSPQASNSVYRLSPGTDVVVGL